MRFLVDNQLPAALARWLTAEGHDAIHVLDVALAQANDSSVCDFARTQSRVVVSKDEDYLALVLRPDEKVQFVWVRMPNCRNAALLKAFGEALSQTIALLDSGQTVVELR